MFAENLLAEFAKKAPVPVMLRGILEHVLAPARLNTLFDHEAERQYTRELTFATVVDLMCRIVTRVHPSMHAAYRAQSHEIPVGERAVYDKVNGLEPRVSAALVRTTARDLEVVLHTLGAVAAPAVPGYRLKIVDGIHFSATDRRLGPLREGPSPLPGQALAVLDPALGLIIDLFPCEDGHAQERSLLGEVLKTVQPRDLWLEDRNFCTTGFLFGIHRKGAAFLVRQHRSCLRWELVGERRAVGRIDTGQVFEQAVRLRDERGEEWLIRRLTIQLDAPTRDGETELHLLTNLPEEIADGCCLARLYVWRWLIETAFAELTVPLACEIKTLGAPSAAIFAFATAVVCYNALQVLKAAIVTAQSATAQLATAQLATAPPATVQSATVQPAAVPSTRQLRGELSMYYIAHEVSGFWQGLDLMTPPSWWDEAFGNLTSSELADRLKTLASHVNVAALRKRPPTKTRGQRSKPKKPGSHVSTAKVLAGHIPKPKC